MNFLRSFVPCPCLCFAVLSQALRFPVLNDPSIGGRRAMMSTVSHSSMISKGFRLLSKE